MTLLGTHTFKSVAVPRPDLLSFWLSSKCLPFWPCLSFTRRCSHFQAAGHGANHPWCHDSGALYAVCLVEIAREKHGPLTLIQPKGTVAPPSVYVALLGLGLVLSIHAPGLGAVADVAMSGQPFAGFGLRPLVDAVDDGALAKVASSRRWWRSAGLLLAVIACCVSSLGVGMAYAATTAIRIEREQDEAVHSLSESPAEGAELCDLVWGVEPRLLDYDETAHGQTIDWRDAAGQSHRVGLSDNVELESMAMQVELDHMCSVLMSKFHIDRQFRMAALLLAKSLPQAPARLSQQFVARTGGRICHCIVEYVEPDAFRKRWLASTMIGRKLRGFACRSSPSIHITLHSPTTTRNVCKSTVHLGLSGWRVGRRQYEPYTREPRGREHCFATC